jgi:hypothetical protein
LYGVSRPQVIFKKGVTVTFPLLEPQITIRKDHEGHKDRRLFTEGNEGNEGLGVNLV